MAALRHSGRQIFLPTVRAFFLFPSPSPTFSEIAWSQKGINTISGFSDSHYVFFGVNFLSNFFTLSFHLSSSSYNSPPSTHPSSALSHLHHFHRVSSSTLTDCVPERTSIPARSVSFVFFFTAGIAFFSERAQESSSFSNHHH